MGRWGELWQWHLGQSHPALLLPLPQPHPMTLLGEVPLLLRGSGCQEPCKILPWERSWKKASRAKHQKTRYAIRGRLRGGEVALGSKPHFGVKGPMGFGNSNTYSILQTNTPAFADVCEVLSNSCGEGIRGSCP